MRREQLSLKRITAFADLPAAVLRSVESRCQRLDIPVDQPIIDHRNDDDSVYFLIAGRATARLATSSARTVALGHIDEGEMFGELSAIDGQPRSAVVFAETQCVVARLACAAFRELLETEPLVMHAVMRHLAGMARTLTARVFELSVLPVPARLQSELLRIALDGEVDGDTAFVARLPTHSEIANRIATAREVVSREIGRLDRMGVIERRGSAMRIPSISRLEDIVRAALGDGEDVADTDTSPARPRSRPPTTEPAG